MFSFMSNCYTCFIEVKGTKLALSNTLYTYSNTCMTCNHYSELCGVRAKKEVNILFLYLDKLCHGISICVRYVVFINLYTGSSQHSPGLIIHFILYVNGDNGAVIHRYKLLVIPIVMSCWIFTST